MFNDKPVNEIGYMDKMMSQCLIVNRSVTSLEKRVSFLYFVYKG